MNKSIGFTKSSPSWRIPVAANVALALSFLAAMGAQAKDVYLKVSEGSVSNSGGFTTKAANWDPEEAPDNYPENDYYVDGDRHLQGTPLQEAAMTYAWERYHFKGHSLTIKQGTFLLSTQGKVNSSGTDYYKDPVMEFDNGPLNLVAGKMTSNFPSTGSNVPRPNLGIPYPRAWCNWILDINVYSPHTAPFVIGNVDLSKNWVLDCKFNGKLTGAADTGLFVGYSAPTSTWLATYLEMSDTVGYKGSFKVCRYSKVTLDQCRLNALTLARDSTFVLSAAGAEQSVGDLQVAAGAQIVMKKFGSTVLTVTNSVERGGSRLTIDAETADKWWDDVETDPTVVGSKRYPFLKLTATAAEKTPLEVADIDLRLPDSFYAALGDRTFEIVREETVDGVVFSAVITRQRPVFIHSSTQQSWDTCDFVTANAWTLADGQSFVSGDTTDAQNYDYIVSRAFCRAGVTTQTLQTLYMHAVHIMNGKGVIVDSAQHVYPNEGLIFEGGCSLQNWASAIRWVYGRVEVRGTLENPVMIVQNQTDATKLGMNFGAGTLAGGTTAALSLGGGGGAAGCVMSARFETLENYSGAILVTKPYAVALGETASAGLSALSVGSGLAAQLQFCSATNTIRVGDLTLSEESVIEPSATEGGISKMVVLNELSYSGKINIKMPSVLPKASKTMRSFTVLSLPSRYETLTLADFNIDESAVENKARLAKRVWQLVKTETGSVDLCCTYPETGLVILFR